MSDFLTLSLQPYDLNLWYFKLRLFDLKKKFKTSGCKDMGIKKLG